MNSYHYKDWRSVPLPPLMQSMELDKRGYPIPFIIVRDKHGTSYFQINDESKVNQAIDHDLCAICGNKMGADKWLVGGPMSAFHPNGAYIDTPTHQQCLHYALKVCPYLAVPNYLKRLDMKNVDPSKFDDALFFQDPTQDDNRVPFFVAIHIKGFTVSRPEPGRRYLHPFREYLAVEFWNEGIQIDKVTVEQLTRNHIIHP